MESDAPEGKLLHTFSPNLSSFGYPPSVQRIEVANVLQRGASSRLGLHCRLFFIDHPAGLGQASLLSCSAFLQSAY